MQGNFIFYNVICSDYIHLIERIKTFSWGGCRGNANNFATSEECAATCDRQAKFVAAVTADAKTPARFRAPSRFRATPVVDTTQPEVDTNKEKELETIGIRFHTLSSRSTYD